MHVGEHVQIISQGPIIADRLKDYLLRHPEMETKLSKNGKCTFYTTESVDKFKRIQAFGGWYALDQGANWFL